MQENIAAAACGPHKEWGANRNTLLNRSLIRSKLDYGSIIYRSARKRCLKTLDPIYHGGLRLVLEVLRTSPSKSLYAEANEAPANIRSRIPGPPILHQIKVMSDNSGTP